MIYILFLFFSANAGEVQLPNVFSNGAIADADDVNANFTAIKTAVDNNHGRIATLEASTSAMNCTTKVSSVAGDAAASGLALKAALEGTSCTSGHLFIIDAGEFDISNSITLPSNATMRGAGGFATNLSFDSAKLTIETGATIKDLHFSGTGGGDFVLELKSTTTAENIEFFAGPQGINITGDMVRIRKLRSIISSDGHTVIQLSQTALAPELDNVHIQCNTDAASYAVKAASWYSHGSLKNSTIYGRLYGSEAFQISQSFIKILEIPRSFNTSTKVVGSKIETLQLDTGAQSTTISIANSEITNALPAGPTYKCINNYDGNFSTIACP